MKFAYGNEKLGPGCLVVSRPVGDTCPSSCQFLGNGCYAQFTEKRFPNARKAGFENLHSDRTKIRVMILTAVKEGKSIRWHERGDFGLDNSLDMEYIENIEAVCLQLLRENKALPQMWAYTHIYDSRILTRLSQFITIYASVHNAEDMQAAKAAGFKLFAWCDTDGQFPKKGKGGNPDAPKLAIIENERFVTCPEMRRGRDTVTCTGSKDTLACKLCTMGTANVLFLKH